MKILIAVIQCSIILKVHSLLTWSYLLNNLFGTSFIKILILNFDATICILANIRADLKVDQFHCFTFNLS